MHMHAPHRLFLERRFSAGHEQPVKPDFRDIAQCQAVLFLARGPAERARFEPEITLARENVPAIGVATEDHGRRATRGMRLVSEAGRAGAAGVLRAASLCCASSIPSVRP